MHLKCSPKNKVIIIWSNQLDEAKSTTLVNTIKKDVGDEGCVIVENVLDLSKGKCL